MAYLHQNEVLENDEIRNYDLGSDIFEIVFWKGFGTSIVLEKAF